MKKILGAALALALCAAYIAASAAGGIGIYINGRKAELSEPAFIENGRTLVPVRGVFENMDAAVGWDGETRTVEIVRGGDTLILKIGETEAFLNGRMVSLDVPAQIVRDRTYVPVRFVSENMSCAVTWDAQNRAVRISEAANIFGGNTADSEITAKVTSLSQYEYGVAKITVDGETFCIDKKGKGL